MKKQKRTAVYLRVSTFNRQEKGLDSQERALRMYCQNQGFTRLVWYKDRMTGATINRPQFKKLQKDIFAGKIDTVIVWKLDRISRSLQDGINVLCDWLKKGIRIIAVTQQLDFNGAVGQMIASLLFAVAAMERESLRENTKRGIAAARARGVKLGKRPGKWCKKVVPLLEKGLSVAEAARKLNKSTQAVYNVLEREDIDLGELRKRSKYKL